MKSGITITIALVAGLAASAFMMPADEIKQLELGASLPMPEYKMQEVSGKEIVLKDIKKEKGLLVVFSCNSCPFVVGNGETSEGWEGRYNNLGDVAARRNIGMILVNSNEAKRDGDDSFEKMQARAKEKAYRVLYALDKNSALANAFGAKTTPHVFLFDQNLKLVYKGAIDDNVGSAASVKERYLIDAISSVGAGEEIKVKETKPMGCSIKRVK